MAKTLQWECDDEIPITMSINTSVLCTLWWGLARNDTSFTPGPSRPVVLLLLLLLHHHLILGFTYSIMSPR
jgi:hypothetical protein